MSGSYFITQTSKFLLIDAKAVTLGQGHSEVIQYISPDSYIICANIEGLAQPVWMWEAKVVAAAYGGGGGRTRRKRTENLKSPQTGVT